MGFPWCLSSLGPGISHGQESGLCFFSPSHSPLHALEEGLESLFIMSDRLWSPAALQMDLHLAFRPQLADPLAMGEYPSTFEGQHQVWVCLSFGRIASHSHDYLFICKMRVITVVLLPGTQRQHLENCCPGT